MTDTGNCQCSNIDKFVSPFDLIAKGEFEKIALQSGAYYQEVTLRCKQCKQLYTAHDHMGYHYNYWTWQKRPG